VYVSDLQTVDADPLADIQPWHRDNSSRSLTVLIPLYDVQEANGPTELILKSHLLYPSHRHSHLSPKMKGSGGWRCRWEMWREFFFSFFAETEGSIRPCLKAGDILIYDSRVIHRG
ncbi:phytanoyl- dioxygenase superfamily protein, partial [Cystoisospora suis]